MPLIKYLLWLRDKVGVSEEYKEFNELSQVINYLITKHPLLSELYSKDELIILINGIPVNRGANVKLRENDEIIVLPPVSGG
ncbi:MoaD/ThiS family protein [Thermogladius sp. 4427co]|uniref:MoaD/ThiS family protein n=1 Tax=Thermogladius sp. 4427co TaxID=3450718 RepID=UPI003F7A58E8